MKRWAIRIVVALVALHIVALLADKYALRGIGTRVSIGERSLQLDCRGSGSPTVVFESGLVFSGSLSWAKVHDPIAELSRACAYSRAGMLGSDPAPDARDAEAIAADLQKLLNAAGENPPFIMVGHSMGGPYSMVYTKNFGAEVAGLVFVDASHPDQMRRISEVLGSAPYPGKVSPVVKALAPNTVAAALEEQSSLEQTLNQAATFRDLGARPLFVLTGLKDTTEEELKAQKLPEAEFKLKLARGKIWQELQADEAGWSSVSQHQSLPDAGHFIQDDNPDAVIAAVKWVLEHVRNSREPEEKE